MTDHEWKPGDAAMLRLDADTEIRVTRTEHGDWVSDKGTRYDPALPARPIEAAAICGAKPPWPWGTGAPGCSKAAGHDGDHAGHDTVWADPNPAPLAGRAYVEDLERRAAERDTLAHDLEAANEKLSALRVRLANLERDNYRLERERDQAREEAAAHRALTELRAKATTRYDGSRITPAGVIIRTGWHVPLKGPIHHGAVPNPECGICQAQTAPATELRDKAGPPPAREVKFCNESHPDDFATVCDLKAGHDCDHQPDHGPSWPVEEPEDEEVTCAMTVTFDGHIRACDLDADHSPAEPHRSTGRAEVIWR